MAGFRVPADICLYETWYSKYDFLGDDTYEKDSVFTSL